MNSAIDDIGKIMNAQVDETDVWLFRELYAVLAKFAHHPQYTIDRTGGGRISVPEDESNGLNNLRRSILEKYPHLADLKVMRVAAEIDAILSRKSLGGEEFEEWFWTNDGFQRHEDWGRIRQIARAFLIQ